MEMHNPAHPGEILKELYIGPLHLSVTEVAKGLRITRKTLSALINGRSGISPEMAIRLAKAFNTTPNLWLNMQTQYDLWKAGKKKELAEVKIFMSPVLEEGEMVES